MVVITHIMDKTKCAVQSSAKLQNMLIISFDHLESSSVVLRQDQESVTLFCVRAKLGLS